jgi:hypothetical protein
MEPRNYHEIESLWQHALFLQELEAFNQQTCSGIGIAVHHRFSLKQNTTASKVRKCKSSICALTRCKNSKREKAPESNTPEIVVFVAQFVPHSADRVPVVVDF